MELLLLTTLESVDSSVIKSLESRGYSVEVLKVKSLEPSYIAEVLRDRSFDYAITPGSSPYDYTRFGGKVVKGTVSLKTLPYIIELLGPENLSPIVQAEKMLDHPSSIKLARRVLGDAIAEARWAFDIISRARISLRPPPMLVASDVYVKGVWEDVLVEASYRVSEGADIIVLSGLPNMSRRSYIEALEAVMDLGAPVAVDPGDISLLVETLDMGAPIAMSLTHNTLDVIPRRLRDDRAYVIIPRSMGDWRYRVEELCNAYNKALSMGYRKVILDPVVNPPVNRGLLTAFITAKELTVRVEAPVMLGINNAVELMDIDTHATIGLLTIIAAEAGASIIMVGEESYKARGSTREAKIATQLASITLKLETPPKDLGITMLYLKGKKPPDNITYKGSGTITVEGLKVDCRDAKSLKEVEEIMDKETWIKILETCTPWIKAEIPVTSW